MNQEKLGGKDNNNTITNSSHRHNGIRSLVGRTKNRTGIAVFSLFAMMILSVPFASLSTSAYAATTKLDITQFQLQIIPLASKLPADSGKYFAMIQLQTVKDRNPIAAPYDFDITVISSDPSVLIGGEEKITMHKGEFMTKAELMTTKKAGEVSISAQAEGIKSASVTINTLSLDSLEPTKLTISAAISGGLAKGIAVPDPKVPETLYIQLLNSRDLPAISDKSIVISLSSSKPQVGTVPSYATIPAGQSGISIDFLPNTELGTTTISASSTGLSPANLEMKTDGPVATKLAVDFGPSIITAGIGASASTITVQLRDDNDNPVKSTRDIEVTLKSSDESVADMPPTVKILAGHSYASAPVRAKGGMGCVDPDIVSDGYGCAVVTATATGLESGISALRVSQAAESNVPYSIKLYSVPAKLPPDNSEHAAIVIQFVDDDLGEDVEHLKPFSAAGQTMFNSVVLSTSDSKLGSVGSNYEPMTGYSIAKFKTTYFVGTTTLTASRTGFGPAQMDLEIAGAAPAAVKLSQIPTTVEANNIESDLLSVSLADPSGKPVIAPEDIVIQLSSSDSAIATVQPSVVIPAGSAFVIEKVAVTDKVGQTTITASTPTLASANLPFVTKGSKGTISQYALGIFALPKLSADNTEQEAIFIQLQDLTGNPVPAKDDILVTLSSSSSVAGTVESQVTISAGSSYTTAKFHTTTIPDKNLKITASSPGFKSVEAAMPTTVQPIAVKITNSVPRQGSFENDEIFLDVQVTSNSLPVEGATIEVGGAQSSPTTAITDENGFAEGRYVSARPGSNIIEVKATKPGYDQNIAKVTVPLSQTVDVVVKAVSQGGTEIATKFTIAPAATTTKSYSSEVGKPVTFKNAKFGTYRVTAPDEFTSTAGKFKFVSWSDGETANPRSFNVITDTEIKAVYAAQFLMQASSDYGTVSGNRYYKEGETATLSIDKTSISDGPLVDKNFAGWSGDIASQSPTTEVKMDAPKVIKADWQASYWKLIILAAGIGGGGFAAYWKILKPRKDAANKSKAPDLDWYKS